jgi:glyoxylase-like metal-dependent hydrolase (beta-lactamase superfamily II)
MATFRRESELIGIGTSPMFGIGQRALLVRTPEGNVLWDCISLIDDAIVEIVNGLGGLKAIAISHPHYYTTMIEWSAAFGGIPVYLHAADKRWIMRSAPCLKLWADETKGILPGLTLIRVGGHFEGGTVMHWAQGAEKKGALLSGDLLQVTADRKFVSFMWSYPNFIPLGEKAVRAIAERLKPWSYEVIYGAFWDRVIPKHGTSVTEKSVARHIEILHHEAR